MLQVLFTLSLSAMMLVINMDMNQRMIKQNETLRVDAELIQVVNELRRDLINITGNINNLTLSAQIGTANLRQGTVFADNVTYKDDGVFSMRVKSSFERLNVYGPKNVTRDIGLIYCKLNNQVISDCSLTFRNETHEDNNTPCQH